MLRDDVSGDARGQGRLRAVAETVDDRDQRALMEHMHDGEVARLLLPLQGGRGAAVAKYRSLLVTGQSHRSHFRMVIVVPTPGVDSMVNVAHASDSPETAEAELKRFFKNGEVFAR